MVPAWPCLICVPTHMDGSLHPPFPSHTQHGSAGLFPTAEQLEDFALLLQSQIESPGQQQQQAMMLNPSAAVAAAGASASASAAGRARQANGGGGSSSSLEKGSQERLQEEGEVNGAEAAAVDGGHNEGEEEGEGQGAWRPAGVWVTHSPLKWEADGWMAGWLPRKPGVGNGHRAEGAAGGGWDWDGEGRPGARGAEGGRRTGAKDRGQAAATAAAAAAAAAAEASEALQRELGLMEVMDSFFSMAEVSSTYFMCRSRSMAAIASYLAQLQPLSIAERYVLCSVPVNVRDRLAMQMLYQFAAARAARRPMPLAIRLPREPPRTLLGMNELCTKNSVLDAYLWLSHKFPSTFVQREAALEMRQSCIGLLEEGIKLGMTVEHDHAERDAVLRRQYAMRLERLRAKGAPLTAPGLPTAAPLPSEIPGPILAADSSPSPSAAPGETEAEAAEAAAASLESASSLGAVRTEEDDGYENDDEEAMVERELEVAEDEKERAALLASEDPAVLGLDEHKEKGGGGGGQ